MNTDPVEHSSIDELLVALVEERISEVELARLDVMLAENADARRRYLGYIQLVNSLRRRHGSTGRALADEERERTALEAKPFEKPQIGATRATRKGRAWERPGLGVLAASVVIVVVTAVLLTRYLSDQDASLVGVVTHVWSSQDPSQTRFREGMPLGDGLLEVESERIQVALINGATLLLDQQTTVALSSPWRLQLVSGTVSARLTRQAAGFGVDAPGVSVVDLGTEFSLRAQGRSSRLEVFEGFVKVLDHLRESTTARELEEGRMGQYDESQALYRTLAPNEELLPRVDRSFSPDPSRNFSVREPYVKAVLDAKPLIYWRFEGQEDGVVKNEAADSYHGRLEGNFEIGGSEENHWLRFEDDGESRMVISSGGLDNFDASSYSMEVWVLPARFSHATLVSIHEPEGSPLHKTLGIVELTSTGLSWLPFNVVRFTHRMPPRRDFEEGVNVYSKFYRPATWNHVVATKGDGELRLYLNGEFVGRVNNTGKDDDNLYDLVLGKIDKSRTDRQFVGLLDEFALYSRALAADEVRKHYEMVRQKP